MDQAARGANALAAGNHQEAIKEFTAAIAQNPKAVDYYIKRSTAYQRSSDLDAAFEDAEHAVLLATDRGKRELIAEAQLRRAIILFTQERYGDAGFVFAIVKKLNEKEKTLGIWQLKVEQKLKNLPENDEKAKVTVQEKPEPRKSKPAAASNGTATSAAPAAAAAAAAAASASTVVQTPPNKIKHDWYQSNDKVIFTLLAKGVPKDKAQIDIQPTSLTISFPTINTDSTYDFSLDPLFGAIDPSQSTFNITPNKVEVTLKKQVVGQKWHSLEGTETPTTPSSNGEAAASSIRQPPIEPAKAPAYPTSSRTGPKNWDKVVDNLSSKSKKETDNPADAKPTDTSAKNEDDVDYGDLDDDDTGGDAAGAFFKKLFKNADPDTQRAMMKSYQESNGTVLSTSWAEVGKGKVETQPPDGMVAKEWGK